MYHPRQAIDCDIIRKPFNQSKTCGPSCLRISPCFRLVLSAVRERNLEIALPMCHSLPSSKPSEMFSLGLRQMRAEMESPIRT